MNLNMSHETRDRFDSVIANGDRDGLNDGDHSTETFRTSRTLVIIDSRALDRECLAKSIRSHGVEWDVVSFGSVQEWRSKRGRLSTTSVIVLSIGGRKVTEAPVAEEIRSLSSDFPAVPVVILADTDQLPQILKALEFGARGFIPTSVGIDVCIEAIRLALAGGTFVPVNNVLAIRQAFENGDGSADPVSGIFTPRQAEVADALRRGKANKIIAYELNLRESTVKVHVRNIMKKLKATNRTEVAYKVNDLYSDNRPAS
jgi:DNA-binding NarL/FixJ family response regulator